MMEPLALYILFLASLGLGVQSKVCTETINDDAPSCMISAEFSMSHPPIPGDIENELSLTCNDTSYTISFNVQDDGTRAIYTHLICGQFCVSLA